ncbi:MAG TPA: HD domain-containing phosphohydrolase [Gemmatimonadales bacterium]|nr:HD domain-containing phosphohydrolase [Gemmatimonadales bacterium]
MSGDPVKFLGSLAQALAGMSLYADGHPARDRGIDAAFEHLVGLQLDTATPLFTFLGDEVVYGKTPIRELKAWDWSMRLAQAGIQRLEFQPGVTREEFEDFLDDVLARLTLATIDTSEVRQGKRSSIKFGSVGIRGEQPRSGADIVPEATIRFSLGEEAEAMRWLHEEVKTTGGLPLAEAEAVVRSLSVAMHGDQQIVLPLLHLKEFDQYTTTHSMNVSVLAMALAEFMGLGASDVRGFGVAGLLHDLGKTRIPIDILTKPGKLTPDEREAMNAHPAQGARIILEAEEKLDLAAVVAYEHHIMLNGGGYPRPHYGRACHRASNLVHVCDVYDALRTNRPYRDAWEAEKILPYLEGRAGMEFDPEIVAAFIAMMRKWEPRVAVLNDEQAPVVAPGVSTNGGEGKTP